MDKRERRWKENGEGSDENVEGREVGIYERSKWNKWKANGGDGVENDGGSGDKLTNS